MAATHSARARRAIVRSRTPGVTAGGSPLEGAGSGGIRDAVTGTSTASQSLSQSRTGVAPASRIASR